MRQNYGTSTTLYGTDTHSRPNIKIHVKSTVWHPPFRALPYHQKQIVFSNISIPHKSTSSTTSNLYGVCFTLYMLPTTTYQSRWWYCRKTVSQSSCRSPLESWTIGSCTKKSIHPWTQNLRRPPRGPTSYRPKAN